MGNSTVTSVRYDEDIVIRVATYLRSRGYTVAGDCLGYLCSVRPGDDCVSILLPPNNPHHIFSHLLGSRRMRYVAAIWFSNHARSANRQDWVMEIYGLREEDHLMAIANELAGQFNVHIRARTVSRQEREEYRSGDGADY